MKNRVLWIDGIKGFSCILILVHHYFLSRFPASYYGSARESLWNGVDTYLSQSVLSFFMNGNFFVNLYILITGYVTVYQIRNMQNLTDSFFKFSLKRYLKLSFPLLMYCLIIWMISLISGTHNEGHTIFNVFKSGIIKILFLGNTDFGGHLWMLNYTFLGGFAVSIVALCSFHFSNKKMILLNFIIIFTLLVQREFGLILYATCFSGALAYFIIEYINEIEVKHRRVIFLFMFVLSIFLGAYPNGVIPTNYYSFFRLPVPSRLIPFFWHFISAFLFFLSTSQIRWMHVFWELSVNQKLAKYSFAFYILHGIGLSLVFMISKKLDRIFTTNYVMVSLLLIPVAILVSMILAFLFQYIIIRPYNRLIDCLIVRFQTKKRDIC